jgi:bis(5'-nucleosyl)-tetraphosphatase (symmetrical)
LRELDGVAHCLLGNHDLHLLAVAQGLRKAHRKDTLDSVLQAPDREDLLDWLRHRAMAMHLRHHGVSVLMVHAGVLPAWTCEKTMALAAEVQTMLRGPDYAAFLATMYSKLPDQWDDGLQGNDRLRVIVNALTRIRFCDAQGRMEFHHSGGLDQAPAGYMPWFDVPDRQTRDTTVAFGHWSSLSALNRDDVIELDTGCVWGRCLSALKIDPGSGSREKIHVSCREPELSVLTLFGRFKQGSHIALRFDIGRNTAAGG